ncbi:trypsin-like peptidase domain-containing protein [Streptomyces sp. NPDC048751]|uniref:trypsin-like peptidase domain-containing protein n=1 Tax=Streptomyces sp. NPDC048751 TaxID=3365591 RepID=UPI0037113D62
MSLGVPGFLGSVLHPSQDSPVGTCFQLVPGVLATACHVLDDLELGVPGAEVRFAPLAGGPVHTAVVDRVDPPNDLAVLRTDSPLPGSATGVAPTAKAAPGTELVVEGFGDVPAYDGHTYQYLTASGRWAGTTRRDDGVRLGRLSTKDLLRGMSGAPVRRCSDDVVIGVVSARYNSPDGWLRDSVWAARTEDLAALAPRELSWFSPHLRTHEQVLRGLDGKEQYLTAGRLEFVSPGPGSRAAPARLMDVLDAQFDPRGHAEPQRGVLLEGVAGAGKTRTCHEVAKLASERAEGDWLVLHATPASGVTAEELVEAALAHAGVAEAARVLLVLDYLDSYAQLSLARLSEALQTGDPEGRVACLASARPGALKGLARQTVLTRVPLEDGEEYRARVADEIFRKVAPRARRLWGESWLVDACSDRPVFALLIARVLEEQARAGQRAPDLSDLRRGELFDWLRRQLERDFGVPTAADREAGLSRPHVFLLASTVALLACPQDRSLVESAVDRALEARGDAHFGHDGGGVVGELCRQGWLVGSDDRPELVHDIVADGLLDATLAPGEAVQSRTAQELLDALLDRGPVFAQAVRHLSRWSTDQEEYRQAEIESVCARWLARRADSIGSLLSADARGETAFDLVARPPWQAGMLRLWDELVGPWLARIESEQPTALPAVLAQAVDKIVGPLPERLLDSALACLESRPAARETDILLQALLYVDGLAPDRLDVVARHALGWVERHPAERRSAQLLGAALARPDLPPAIAPRVVEAAREWTRRHPGHPAGSVVLGRLLDRQDLGPHGKPALDAALTWIVRQNDNPGVSFVLPRLLRRTDLGVHRDRAVGHALAWLRDHHTSAQASFVLRPLLRTDLTHGEARQAVEYAKVWLAHHGDGSQGFVLGPLLRWDESAAERVSELLRQPVIEPTQGLLADLLREKLPRPLLGEVVDASLGWLRHHGQGPDSILLHLLLGRLSPHDAAWAEASDMAVRWLKRYGTAAEASFLLNDLLTAEPGRADIARLALEWLALPGVDPHASYVLRPLLWCHGSLAEDQAQQALDLALRWLEGRADGDDAGFVVEPLLFLPSLGPDHADAVVRAAVTWLRGHAERPNADRVLGPLLGREDLAPALRAEVEELTVVWFERYPQGENALKVLLTLFAERGPAPGPECAAALAPHALERMPEGAGATPLLIGLLHTVPSGTEQRAALIDHTITWLARRGTVGRGADQVFAHLLAQRDLTEEQLARSAERFLTWMEPRATSPAVARPLSRLLRHTGHAPWRAAAVTRALAWLACNAHRAGAGDVLDALLHDPDPPVDCRADVRRWAREWMETSGPTHWSWAPITEALGIETPPQEEAGGGSHM